ncbi:hypothetical protein HAL1_05553 [Halomonas sp. HAL1]|nr:hypothetical protein HAL1_05553 [Halomonas sp. HAL1]
MNAELSNEFSKQLLVIAHAPSANTRLLREAAARGASHPDLEQVQCVVKAPLEAGPEDVLACDAILLGTTENLGYTSGALKASRNITDNIFCLLYSSASARFLGQKVYLLTRFYYL